MVGAVRGYNKMELANPRTRLSLKSASSLLIACSVSSPPAMKRASPATCVASKRQVQMQQRSRTLELLLAHSRSCSSAKCVTCSKLPHLLQQQPASSSDASFPYGAGTPAGLNNFLLVRRISTQLNAIQRAAWERGSRLPCGEILVSPDFLAMFLDACGITALLPFADTCTAWRDACNERPEARVTAMIDAITIDASISKRTKAAAKAAAAQPAALLAPHAKRLVTMCIEAKRWHSGHDARGAERVLTTLRKASAPALAAQVPSIIEKGVAEATAFLHVDTFQTIDALDLVGRAALMPHLRAIVALVVHEHRTIHTAALRALNVILIDPDGGTSVEADELALAEVAIWSILEAVNPPPMGLFKEAVVIAAVAFPPASVQRTLLVAAKPMQTWDDDDDGEWHDMSSACISFVSSRHAVAPLAPDELSQVLAQLTPLLHPPDVMDALSDELADVLCENIKLFVQVGFDFTDQEEQLWGLVGNVTDAANDGASFCHVSMEAFKALDTIHGAFEQLDGERLTVLVNSCLPALPSSDELFPCTAAAAQNWPNDELMRWSQQIYRSECHCHAAKSIAKFGLGKLRALPVETLQRCIDEYVDRRSAIDESAISIGVISIGDPTPSRWRGGTAQLLAMLHLHLPGAVSVQSQHLEQLLYTKAFPDEFADAPVITEDKRNFLGPKGLLAVGDFSTYALLRPVDKLGTALALLNHQPDMCTNMSPCGLVWIAQVFECIAACCNPASNPASGKVRPLLSRFDARLARLSNWMVIDAMKLVAQLDLRASPSLWEPIGVLLRCAPRAINRSLLGGVNVDVRSAADAMLWRLEELLGDADTRAAARAALLGDALQAFDEMLPTCETPLKDAAFRVRLQLETGAEVGFDRNKEWNFGEPILDGGPSSFMPLDGSRSPSGLQWLMDEHKPD